MPNRWTGAFDAALELAPAGADRLLAAVHRKGHPQPDAPASGPHFLHSLALNLPIPGAASERDLGGHLQVQVSTPSVSVADEAGRVTVSVELYAWFQKALGSDPAPEFVHGTLAFTTGVEVVQCSGNTLAEIRVAASDVALTFTPAPGSGLDAADAALVEEVAADVLSKTFRPVQMRIPKLGAGDFEVERFAFKTLRAGSRSALAILLGFTDGGPAPDPAAVSEVFLATADDLALALGREFVTATLRELARDPLSGIEVSGSRFWVDFRAAPDPATLEIELRPGRVRARLDGSGSLSPGGSFEFRLTQDFGLAVIGGQLALTLADEPGLEITRGNFLLRRVFGLFKGRILDALQQAASGVLPVANQELNAIVDRSVGDLLTELEVPGVRLVIGRAGVDPDGVILGGAFDVGPTRPAVASFTNQIKRPPGAPVLGFDVEYDALQSWIPGGTIQRYHWVEVRADGAFGRHVNESQRFVMRLAPELATVAQSYGWPPYTWCLEVHGTQFVDAHDPVPVSGAVCGLSVVVPSIDLPRAAGRLALQIPDGKGGVRADLDPWGRYRPHAFADREENRGVLLVHLADEPVGEALKVLRGALVEANRELPVFPTVVVAGGPNAFACGAPLSELSDLALTHDPEGEWRRRFRLERPGATVIVGPAGRELWRDAGPLQAEVLEKVLQGLRLGGARPPRWTPVRLGLGLGTYAPDFVFPCGEPQVSLALSKTRGRSVELCFWTTWSEASLEELRRRSARSCEDAGGPLILCVNDGEDPELAAQVLRKNGIEHELVPDPERRISRKYGVSCWPTVVRVDAAGRVAAVRFGLEPEPDAAVSG